MTKSLSHTHIDTVFSSGNDPEDRLDDDLHIVFTGTSEQNYCNKYWAGILETLEKMTNKSSHQICFWFFLGPLINKPNLFP